MKRSLATVVILTVALGALVVPAWAASDPGRSKQWGLTRIKADQAWSASKGSGVTIAIVDTGIDLTHPDLKSKISSHYSCTGGTCSGGSSAGDDDNGHGSHVAGIAAAATSNGIGIAGVAPSAKLMAVKALDNEGSGACGDITSGIEWAADHGADVVNLSLGPEIVGLGLLCVGPLQDAAEYAWNKGVVVVISAGNDGLFNLYSSSALLVVGATGPDDREAGYSNSGADVFAPGGNRGSSACTASTCVYSTWKDGAYASIQGTSMAAPHVSGIAALLLARGYAKSEVRSRLLSTADNVNGILRVNAARAVGSAGSTSSPKTSPKSSSSSRSSSPTTGQPSTVTPTVLGAKASSPPTTPGPASSASVSESPSQSPIASDQMLSKGSSVATPAVIAAAAVAAAILMFAGVRTMRRRKNLRA